MSQTSALRIAAVLGFLAVAFGAFGAHSLKELLTRQNTAAIWEKAVLYHAIHAVMMFVIASRPQFSPFPWWCFFIGVLLLMCNCGYLGNWLAFIPGTSFSAFL